MIRNKCLLLEVLKSPEITTQFSLQQWDILVRQARTSQLLARLDYILKQACIQTIPAKVFNHLFSIRVVAEKQHAIVQWEVEKIKEALSLSATVEKTPVVLLKGAAYVFAELPNYNGRLFSDIDLLVKKGSIEDVEGFLLLKGWLPNHQDEYDNRYYREWMHEIPPLQHFKRCSVLDVHHTILPPTAKYHPDPKKILANISELKQGIFVLSSEDMVIHSATHLFHEGEFDKGLRDLVDIVELMKHFSKEDAGFWNRLVDRAIELDLIRPLYYGLHYAERLFEIEVPSNIQHKLNQGKPNIVMSSVMDFLFSRALLPDHPSCDKPFISATRFILYMRSHYLRMPMRLLIPHLVRKAWKRRFERKEPETPLIKDKEDNWQAK